MCIDYEFIRERANLIRHNFVEEMEKNLLAFESAAIAHDLKVQWIVDEEHFVQSFKDLLKKPKYNAVCFDMDIIPEDLLQTGNVIKQVKVENFGRESTDILLIQADFGIVENGMLVLLNKPSMAAIQQVTDLVVLLNINDLILKQADLETIVLLKQDKEAFFSDFKFIQAPFEHILSKPFLSNEDECVEKEQVNITVFLYDNGISDILFNPILRESLYCIHCGKCAEVCPVFRQTNLFSPIQLIKYNFVEEHLREKSIFENTCLCGNCEQICPVKIPLVNLLIKEMETLTSQGGNEAIQNMAKTFLKRHRLNKMNTPFHRYFFIRKLFAKNKNLYNYFKEQKEPFYNMIADKNNE